MYSFFKFFEIDVILCRQTLAYTFFENIIGKRSELHIKTFNYLLCRKKAIVQKNRLVVLSASYVRSWLETRIKSVKNMICKVNLHIDVSSTFTRDCDDSFKIFEIANLFKNIIIEDEWVFCLLWRNWEGIFLSSRYLFSLQTTMMHAGAH